MIFASVTSMLQSEAGCCTLQVGNGHLKPRRLPGRSGYEICSRSSASGRQTLQSEFPQGRVTGSRKGFEHCGHCIRRTSCLASSNAVRAVGLTLFPARTVSSSMKAVVFGIAWPKGWPSGAAKHGVSSLALLTISCVGLALMFHVTVPRVLASNQHEVVGKKSCCFFPARRLSLGMSKA